MNTSNKPHLQVLKQQAAHDMIAQNDFTMAWDKLYKNCPWATGYQSVEYVVTWYKMFSTQFSPLLLLTYKDNELNGLFALAQPINTNEIVVAGNQHPEYRVWLALTENSAHFILQAFAWLQKNCSHPLNLNYLPHNVELKGLSWHTPLRWHCILKAEKNNWLRMGGDEWLQDYMRSKKRLKTKFNKMKRMGTVEFKRVTDPQELDVLLDQIIPLYEFRQGAVHHMMPFHMNPLKRSFTLELLAQKRLHASVLMVDDAVLGALLSVCGRGQVHLGEIAYSVFHPDVSPGLIHLWLLVQSLAEDKFKVLDLTPGGDGYKNRFANDSVTLHQFTFYPKLTQALYPQAKWLLKSGLNTVKSWLKHETRPTPSTSPQWHLIKTYTPENMSTGDDVLFLGQKNAVSDVLCFQGGYQAALENIEYFNFLEKSFNLINQGASVYTLVEDNRLIYAVWMIDALKHNQLKYFPSSLQENEACILSIYPDEQQQPKVYQQALEAVLIKDKTTHLLKSS